MEEYLHERAGRVGDLLAASRAFHAFAHATPGMRELLTIGKVVGAGAGPAPRPRYARRTTS